MDPVDKNQFENAEWANQKVREAVRKAVQRNKDLGNPLPEQVGDDVRVVPADELPDEEEGRDSLHP